MSAPNVTVPAVAARAAVPADAEQAALAVRRAWEALWRRRAEFVTAFVLTALLVLGIFFVRPAKYAARAALLVEPSRGSARTIADPEDGPTVVSAGVTEAEVNTETSVLTSDEVVRATVREAHLDAMRPSWYMRILLAPFRAYDALHAQYHGVEPPSDEDRAVRGLLREISAERMKASNVLVVTFNSGDPRFAQAVLQILMKHYLDHHLKVHARYAPAAFFSEQLAVMQDSVTRREGDLQAMKRGLGVVDLPKERDTELATEARLREEAASVARRLAEIEGLLASDRAMLADAAGAQPARRPLESPHLAGLKAEVLRLTMDQVQLEGRYNDSFPLVAENREKLRLARQAVAAEEANVLGNSPAMRAVDTDAARVAAEEAGLRRRAVLLDAQIARSRARLLRLDRALPEAERAEREIRTAERRYDVYLSSSDKSRVETALDRGRLSNVSVIQEPAALTTAEGPKKWMVLLIALGGGVLTGVLVCAVLELRATGMARVIHTITPEPVTA